MKKRIQHIVATGLLLLILYSAHAQSTLFIDIGESDLFLHWYGESNVTYTVEHSDSLIVSSWTNSGFSTTGEASTVTMSISSVLGIPLLSNAFFRLGLQYPDNEVGQHDDMLTPLFYLSASNTPFRAEVNRFIYYSQIKPFHHPLANASNQIPSFTVPTNGEFGAGKGPGGTAEHHAAVDLHVGSGETNVEIYAAHDGFVSTYRDAEKYRHYLSISKDVMASNGDVVGTIVTLYAHIDLDLDEGDSLFMDGQYVNKGELVSQHLYSGTLGGPHLHFEIRYYRPGDTADETFYGWGGDPEHTEPSAGPWSYGYWNPDIGYGFGDPRNHGLSFY